MVITIYSKDIYFDNRFSYSYLPGMGSDQDIACSQTEAEGGGSWNWRAQDLLGYMEASGIEKSVLLPLAKGRADVSSLNDWILSVSSDGLIPFGAVHPFMENLEAELDRLALRGVRGVKMMPLLQEVYPDDPRCERLYEALIKKKMILVTHAGRDPLERKEIFGTPERFARTIECYPDLQLELAHLGGLRMWDEVQKHLLPAGKNVYFDTAYVSFYMNSREMAEMIKDIRTRKSSIW